MCHVSSVNVHTTCITVKTTCTVMSSNDENPMSTTRTCIFRTVFFLDCWSYVCATFFLHSPSSQNLPPCPPLLHHESPPGTLRTWKFLLCHRKRPLLRVRGVQLEPVLHCSMHCHSNFRVREPRRVLCSFSERRCGRLHGRFFHGYWKCGQVRRVLQQHLLRHEFG